VTSILAPCYHHTTYRLPVKRLLPGGAEILEKRETIPAFLGLLGLSTWVNDFSQTDTFTFMGGLNILYAYHGLKVVHLLGSGALSHMVERAALRLRMP